MLASHPLVETKETNKKKTGPRGKVLPKRSSTHEYHQPVVAKFEKPKEDGLITIVIDSVCNFYHSYVIDACHTKWNFRVAYLKQVLITLF